MSIRKLFWALLAVFACSMLSAAVASAEETLGAEWLVGGKPVLELLSTEFPGSLTLEDTKTIAGAAAILCTAKTVGSVGAAGEGETTEILNVVGEKVSDVLGQGVALLGTGAATGVGSECREIKACAEGTTTSPIEIIPLGLPWHSVIFEDAVIKKFLQLIYSANEIGYELLCLILGINAEDKCIAPENDFEVEIVNDPEFAAYPAGAETIPRALCTQSNEETGRNIVDELTFLVLLTGADFGDV